MESPEACSSGEASPVAAAAERPSEAAALRALVDRVRAGEVDAAREVRRLTRASARHRRKLAAAVDPLVAMLRSGAPDAGEAALLALLNLAVRDERNKTKIVDAGALEPLLGYLQSSDLNLQEYATCAAAVVTDGLLPNGNFEEGPPKSALVNGTVVSGANAIPSWETSGFVEYIESGHKQGDMLLVVPQGAHAVRLGNEASIRQRLSVTRGAYYSITFSAARTCAQAERLNVSVSPEWGVLPMQTIYGSNGWDSYAWAFKAKLDTVTLVIHNPGVEEDPACGPLIDGVAIRALYPPTLARGNMLKNGGFEEGPYFLPNASWGVLVPPNIEDDHSPLPAWMIVSSKAVKYVDAAHFRVPQGARAVELVGGRESALVQEVRTVPGWSYRLAFAVGDAADGCQGSMVAEAYAARATVKVPYESKGTGGYKRAVLDFTAIANRTRVVFQSTFYHMKADGTLCGPLVDDASLVGLRRKPAAGGRRLMRFP